MQADAIRQQLLQLVPPVLLEDARYDKEKHKTTLWTRLHVHHIPAQNDQSSTSRFVVQANNEDTKSDACRHWSSRLQRYCGEPTTGAIINATPPHG
jgi:hypothetical protein